MKKIVFVRKSLESIRQFSQPAKQQAGNQLRLVQQGRDPQNWKSMKTIVQGVSEIRIKDKDGIYRVIYIAKFEEAIYVLHAFQKKTQKTSQSDLNMAKQALNEVFERQRK